MHFNCCYAYGGVVVKDVMSVLCLDAIWLLLSYGRGVVKDVNLKFKELSVLNCNSLSFYFSHVLHL